MTPNSRAFSRRRWLQAAAAFSALGVSGCGFRAASETPASSPVAAQPPVTREPERGREPPAATIDSAPVVTAPPAVIAAKRERPLIGVVAPMSGPFAFEGLAFLRGVEFAFDELTHAGEPLAWAGEPLRFEALDSKAQSPLAAEAADTLLARGAAALLVSGDEPLPNVQIGRGKNDATWAALGARAVAAAAEREQAPLLIGHAHADAVAEPEAQFAFRLGGGANAAVEATIAYLKTLTDLGQGAAQRRIGLLHNEQPLALALAERLSTGLPAAGFELVEAIQHPMAATNLQGPIGRLEKLGVQIVLSCHFWADGRVLADNLATLQPKFNAVVGCLGGAFSQSRLGQQMGARADGLLDVNWALPRNEAWQRVNDRLRQQWPGETFGYHHFLGWSSVKVIARAIAKVDALDGPAIRAALGSTRLEVEFAPWPGPIRFDATGANVAARPPLIQAQDGAPRVVAPAGVADAEMRLPARPTAKAG